jgi:hypothetical protein
MVMRRLDLLQLIAEQPEGFLLHTVQLSLRGCVVALGLFGSRGIFSVVYPGDAEGDARVEFAGKMLGVVVALALDHNRGIGNPLATGKLHFFLLGLDLRLSRANLRALSQHPGPELRQRQVHAARSLLPRYAERVEGVTVHQDVELRFLI